MHAGMTASRNICMAGGMDAKSFLSICTPYQHVAWAYVKKPATVPRVVLRILAGKQHIFRKRFSKQSNARCVGILA
eukprot:scaffold615808_cov17-Prasinocladus_malaysianus.AAC.1